MKRYLADLLSLGFIGLSAAVSVWAWSRVPAQMPVHWNIHGEIDRYGSRVEGLLGAPAIGLGLYLVLLVVPKLGFNHQLFARAYDVLRTSLMGFMFAVHVTLVATALGLPVDTLAVIGGLSGALFVIIGNTMGKLRPNAYAGVRTPWTLTSKLAWTRTNRLAGFLFIGTGLVVMPLALFSGKLAIMALSGGAIGTAIVTVVYSWFVWRADPERGLS